MELRSCRVLQRDKTDVNSGIENRDSSDEKRVSLSSGKSRKGAKEVEIGVCIDNADEELEIGIQNGVNTDDKGLFLGSEVLDPIKDLGVSCPEGEIEEESIKHVKIESSGGEEGNKSASITVSETDPGQNVESGKFADEDRATSAAVLDDAKSRRKKGKERRGRKKFNAGHFKKKKSNQDSDTRSKKNKAKVGPGGECTVENSKKGLKRKNMESSECNGDGRVKKVKVGEGGIPVIRRVLRSQTMTTNAGAEMADGGANVVDGGAEMVDGGAELVDRGANVVDGGAEMVDGCVNMVDGGAEVVDGGAKVVDGGAEAVDSGVKVVDDGAEVVEKKENDQLAGKPTEKRKKRGRPRKVLCENTPSDSQPSLRPQKKRKRRGRPRKVQDETMPSEIPEKELELCGRPCKVQDETMPSEIPEKKLERRGRPRKVQDETMLSEILKEKLERHGRPRKVQDETLPSEILKKRRERRGRPRKVQDESMPTEIPEKKLERRGRPRKVQDETMPSEIPEKKLERRGRPRKVQDETMPSEIPEKKLERRGRPRKVQDETMPSEIPEKKLERRGRPRKVQDETIPSEIPEKKLERRGRPRKVQDETMSSEIPEKKLERRGRPRKVQDETMSSEIPEKKLERRGRPRKVQDETMSSEIPEKKLERRGRPRKVQDETIPSAIPKKKLERRGRPCKVKLESGPKRPQGQPRKAMASQGIQTKLKDLIKKLKHRGRPRKTEAKMLAKVIKMGTVKLMEIKRLSKIHKEDRLSEVTGENPQTVQQPDENGQNKPLEKQKQKCKDFVRDKIVDIILKAGWTIDRRPRQERAYQDKVYIEPSGKSHWSITRAYRGLKKKVENGVADSKEVSAFSPIPAEEMSMLFRPVDKVLGYKKKKNRIQKDVNSGKTKGKKGKLVSKLAKKLLKKPRREKGKITESRKPRLLARSSEKGSKQDNNGGLLHIGKRNLVSWMIDSGVILSGSNVQYGKTRRQKRLFEGTVTGDGIHCSCCNETMGISRFVAHAGGKLDRAFNNVYLESGTSLLKCLLDSWRKEESSNTIGFNHVDVKGDDPNDDTCNICGDGGNLTCCDGCPSTFHESCLDTQIPSGDWNCIYCSCKFCGVVSVTAPEAHDSRDALTSEMLSCSLCEEKFHQSCLQEVEAVNVDSSRLPFCGRKCEEIFERLKAQLGVRHELEDGYSCTLLQRSDVGQDFTVHDTQLKVECNSKLAVAFAVMDECFVPIIDERSGTNIMRNVVYNCGSNFRRLNYAGFFTAILEKDDEFITAASIRIHGHRLAEMPFIGTRHMYRRQGMCRRLLDAVESTLASIGVEELIIPAIPELLQTWTKVFGFMPIEESKRQAMKSMSMLVFPRIDMLQKPLLQTHPSAAVECTSQSPMDAARIAKDAVDYEQAEEAVVVMDVCSCPDLNDKRVSQFGTRTSNAIDCNQRPGDAAGVGNYAGDCEQTEEGPVLMDGCSRPEPNDKGVSQFGPMTTDEKQRPTDAAGVGTNSCSCPKPNGSRFETMPLNAVDNYQRPGKDAADYEQMVVTDPCNYPEDIMNLKNDKLTISHSANSLCDLNFPVKNALCQVPETTDVQTSNLVPKNTFDLNLHPTAVDTDIHVGGDESLPNKPQVCINSFEHGAVNRPDSKSCVML